MTTSKSPNTIAWVAYQAAQKALKPYSHPFSPHKFTQPQLVACLALKEFFTTDYRGISGIIADSSDLQTILELKYVPHFTTLQKAAQKFFTTKDAFRLMRSILDTATKIHVMKPTVHQAALDGTGFESHHVSAYFVKRRDREIKEKYQTTTYVRFPKAGIVCDTSNHLVLAGIPERGPKFDITHFKPALRAASKQKKIQHLVADAGYDSEPNHVFARSVFSMRTIIPARHGRPTDKLPSGKFRKLMATRFNKKAYGQRWQAETVMSMLKRHFESYLRAKTYWSQCREILLRLFTHNVMIVLPS